ncbi:MAG TPA: GNAT family N-acetyltransferase [Solirubrobacteraceae bacterium]|jgi:GNAT superfamily N-acetyltransferase|nr:GNAT family N-acetyltransferase [Solirubrobacteraceae bacterium]
MRRALAGGLELDDDRARIDVDAVHAFISEESYWGRGRTRELQERAIRGSARVVGLYAGAQQVGFARAVSDGATVAYLADVYVLPGYRGRGLGLELVRETVDGAIDGGSDVRWLLHTADAEGLYAKLGFTAERPVYPLMERGRRRAADPAGDDGARSQ